MYVNDINTPTITKLDDRCSLENEGISVILNSKNIFTVLPEKLS